jgi:single-stranded DNA-binding protein
MVSLNLTGRLTREPELRSVSNRSTGDQLEVCQIRVAARDRRGDIVYLDLAEWGAAGRAAAQYLHKGSMIAFAGELRFRETNGDSSTRQFLSAVGHIEFLEGRGVGEKQVSRGARCRRPNSWRRTTFRFARCWGGPDRVAPHDTTCRRAIAHDR